MAGLVGLLILGVILGVAVAILGHDVWRWWGGLKEAAKREENERAWAKHELDAWKDSTAMAERDKAYYRSLVIRCGEAMGPEAKTTDAGEFVPDVLCAKVPELVERMAKRMREG